METFNKTALTAEEQLDLLIKRGLVVNDYESAVKILKTVSYYHLSSYMRNFQFGEAHLFFPNTEFYQIIDLYNFDKDLRHITFNAIEKIEIAYRTAISNVMCINFDSHWFENKNAFINEDEQDQVITIILSEIKKKKKKPNEYAETFIAKYYEKYVSPTLPPFWMVVETFSLGSLNRLYYALKDVYKKEIISYLGFKNDATFIALYSNWLQPLCMVRNICAHHSRLFNRIFKIKAKRHKKIKEFLIERNDNFYYIAMIINYYLKTIMQDTSFEDDIISVFKKYQNINISKLGFPNDWEIFKITKLKKEKRDLYIKNKIK